MSCLADAETVSRGRMAAPSSSAVGVYSEGGHRPAAGWNNYLLISISGLLLDGKEGTAEAVFFHHRVKEFSSWDLSES